MHSRIPDQSPIYYLCISLFAGVASDRSVSKSNSKLRAVDEEEVTESGGQVEAESSLPFTPITLVCRVRFIPKKP